MSAALLDAVSAARREMIRAAWEYHERMTAAREAGHSLSELARAAGISRSGVQHVLRRAGTVLYGEEPPK